MSLMTASRWMLFFWAASFVALHLSKDKLHLDFTDGLIISIFGLTPLFMATLLTVNRSFHEPYIERHHVVSVQADNAWAVIFLENGAYDEFYRIRRFPVDRFPMGDSVTYQFGSGLLGYTVMTGCEW